MPATSDKAQKLAEKAQELGADIEEIDYEEIDVDQLIEDLSQVLEGLRKWKKQGARKLEQWSERATAIGDELEGLSSEIVELEEQEVD